MKALFPLLILLGAMLPSGCRDHAAAPESPEPQPEITVSDNIPSDGFALSLFRSLAAEQNGNIVFSPASLENVLRLLQQGAKGKTAEEFAALPMGRQGIPSAMRPTEASALFIADSASIHPQFKGASVIPAPFGTDGTKAANQINHWARKQTKGMIPEIARPGDLVASTKLIAANAICLDEKWLLPFDNQATGDMPFHCADGTQATVRMMSNKGDYRYARGEDWQAVALFYRTEGRPGHPGCFIGILPQGDARAFAASLSSEKFSDIRQALAKSSPDEIETRLPAFQQLTSSFSLKKALVDGGLGTTFSERADFSGFCDMPLSLQDILQRCYIKVDENGTKAAASTSAVFRCFNPNRPESITFDRPFIWVIGDLSSASPPYFMGLYELP